MKSFLCRDISSSTFSLSIPSQLLSSLIPFDRIPKRISAKNLTDCTENGGGFDLNAMLKLELSQITADEYYYDLSALFIPNLICLRSYPFICQ